MVLLATPPLFTEKNSNIRPMTNVAARYVPELDGLRGIAIIVVLIHHQLTTFTLKGGFLGVDLFFVLSGFLITGLLASEFDKSGSISIRKFYMRRVLRLGPALALYLIACLAVTYYTQLITAARQLKLIAIALLYSTNWRMAFGWDSILDPTAIIWSLSIEEQFYLAWPLLLFACLALKLPRKFIAVALGFVIVAICIHRNVMLNGGADLTRLYYGTDTRADALPGWVFYGAPTVPASESESGRGRVRDPGGYSFSLSDLGSQFHGPVVVPGRVYFGGTAVSGGDFGRSK